MIHHLATAGSMAPWLDMCANADGIVRSRTLKKPWKKKNRRTIQATVERPTMILPMFLAGTRPLLDPRTLPPITFTDYGRFLLKMSILS